MLLVASYRQFLRDAQQQPSPITRSEVLKHFQIGKRDASIRSIRLSQPQVHSAFPARAGIVASGLRIALRFLPEQERAVMNDLTANRPMMNVPSAIDGERAVWEARRLFARTLASWTGDLLELRRREITRVVWREQDMPAIRLAA